MYGNATTAVASLLRGRQFIGIEIENKYLSIAEKRVRPGVYVARPLFFKYF
ncbi:hypothetical protein E4T55_03590 [Legionella israelensis]|nr:hypothetical protein E4T55_03590 [Legionella israelensis]